MFDLSEDRAVAQNKIKAESMDDLLDRLANKLKDGDKASATEVRAELNRIDEEYNKPELRDFVCDLYRTYGYRFLTVGPETHRLEYPCVIIDVPPSLQNLDLTQSRVIDDILQPLGKSPEDDHINKGYNQSQFSDVLSRLTEIENPQRPPWNGDKFALTQLTYSDEEVRLAYHPAKYYDGINTCDYLRFELLKAWKDSNGRIARLETPLTALPCRNRLHSSLEAKDGEDPITSGRFRAANIAVSTLICYPNREDQFLCRLYRRSAYKLMVDRNRFHVAPSAMFEPCRVTETRYQPRSLYENIVREYVEELFLADEETEDLLEEKYGWRWPYDTESGAGVGLEEALISGDASVHCTGIAVSLVNLRMEILTLLIWHTREFVDDWIKKMNPNRTEFARPSETGEGTAVFISLDDDGEQLYGRNSLQPQNMVIAGAAAFWIGRKLLQERPELLELKTQRSPTPRPPRVYIVEGHVDPGRVETWSKPETFDDKSDEDVDGLRAMKAAYVLFVDQAVYSFETRRLRQYHDEVMPEPAAEGHLTDLRAQLRDFLGMIIDTLSNPDDQDLSYISMTKKLMGQMTMEDEDKNNCQRIKSDLDRGLGWILDSFLHEDGEGYSLKRVIPFCHIKRKGLPSQLHNQSRRSPKYSKGTPK